MEDSKIETMMKLYVEYTNPQLDFETTRNQKNSEMFEEIIREGFDNVTMTASGHHFLFKLAHAKVVSEFASADTLIFNHTIAKKIWKDKYKEMLTRLALEPPESRDELLHSLYYNRT